MESKSNRSFLEDLWNGLRYYLNVEMDVGQPENVASNRGYPGGLAAPVSIRLLNTAPIDAEHPKVVFTGISVMVTSTRGRDFLQWATQGRKEVLSEPAKAKELDTPQSTMRSFGTEFPDMTPDESRWGGSLFPGQSVVYSFYVPIDYVPSVEFKVEASISRRHFFHFARTLRIVKDSTLLEGHKR